MCHAANFSFSPIKKKVYQSLSSCIMRTCTERVELTQQYDTANDGERCDVSTKRQNRHLNIFRAQNLKETKTICNTDIFTGKQDTQNQKQLAEDQQRKLFFFFVLLHFHKPTAHQNQSIIVSSHHVKSYITDMVLLQRGDEASRY